MFQSIIGKILKSLILNIDFESWKLSYSSVTWSNNQAIIKQLWPPKTLKISNFKGWGLTLIADK